MLVARLLVVPTESTEDTEAYGLMLFESTDRIDATRHTTEGTEMIAWVASWYIVTYYTSPGAATPQAITTSKGAIIFLQKLDYSDLLQYLCLR